jgi:hypothetical protein
MTGSTPQHGARTSRHRGSEDLQRDPQREVAEGCAAAHALGDARPGVERPHSTHTHRVRERHEQPPCPTQTKAGLGDDGLGVPRASQATAEGRQFTEDYEPRTGEDR